MTVLEIVLLICGTICVVISFIMGNGRSESSENQIVSAELTDKQKESIQNQINAVIEEELEAIHEKTEVTLDKISNTKIMEMNEYVETILGEINRNHNETIFLYDMLNEKAKEVKTTVKDVNVANKQVKKLQAEVCVTSEEEKDYDVDKANVAAAMELLTKNGNNKSTTTTKYTTNLSTNSIDENNLKSATKQRRTKKSSLNKVAENIVEMNIQFEKGANNNDKILKLYSNGKSNKDIAKELSLGVGEVKLVIDLYNSGK